MGFVFPLSSSNFEPNTIHLYFLKCRRVLWPGWVLPYFFDRNTIAFNF